MYVFLCVKLSILGCQFKESEVQKRIQLHSTRKLRVTTTNTKLCSDTIHIAPQHGKQSKPVLLKCFLAHKKLEKIFLVNAFIYKDSSNLFTLCKNITKFGKKL